MRKILLLRNIFSRWMYVFLFIFLLLIGIGLYSQKITETSKPEIPGAGIKIYVINNENKEITQGKVFVSIEHDGVSSYYDYSYNVDLLTIVKSNGVLGLHPTPERTPAKIKLWIVTPDNLKSETITFSNQAFWKAVENTSDSYISSYTFHIGKSEQIIDLSLDL